MLLSGDSIRLLVKQKKLIGENGITGRVSSATSPNNEKILSYGVGPAGYDLRLSHSFVYHDKTVEYCALPGSKISPALPPDHNFFVFQNKQSLSSPSSYLPVADPKNLYDCTNNFSSSSTGQNESLKNDWKFASFDSNLYRGMFLGPKCSVLAQSLEKIEMTKMHMGICIGKSSYARCGLLVNVTPIEPNWRGYLVIELTNLSDYYLRLYPGEGIAQLLFLEIDQPSDYSGRWQDQPPLSEYFV